jgi:hypothetical protein
MNITKLSLTNFRSFKETQTIEFAPVTLLFGPNSVGKSSVLMALFYLQHILAEGDCDPIYLEALGNKYIGGFKGLVHGRDLSKKITIRIDLAKGEEIGSSYTDTRELLEYEDWDELEWLYNLVDSSYSGDEFSLELTIAWSEQSKAAYVSMCKIWLKGIEFGSLEGQPGGLNSTISSLNYLHPMLIGDEHNEWLEECFDQMEDIHTANGSRTFATKGHQVPQAAFEDDDADLDAIEEGLDDDLGLFPTFTDTAFASILHEMMNEPKIPESERTNSTYMSVSNDAVFLHVPISFESKAGCIPLLGKPLKTALSFDGNIETALVNELLTDAIIPVFDNLLSLLEDSLCIGPLRHIPDTNYLPNPRPLQKDWYEGKAAWDALRSSDLERDCTINQWLEDKDKLGLGYRLAYKTTEGQSRFIRPSMSIESVEDLLAVTDVDDSKLMMSISAENLDDNPDANQVDLDHGTLDEIRSKRSPDSDLYMGTEQFKDTDITLWDVNNGIDVSPSDIGVGVSQLFPLVVAAAITRRGVIACEQPELHVHPRVQVGIGDLLTQVNNSPVYLIETHSEHLILRLLRRIRQTAEGELPDEMKKLFPEDVSIVYLEPSPEGVLSRRINIDEDGEFKERWPKGFFAERAEELF